MTFKIDFKTASSHQIETALSKRLEQIRLARNITQSRLSREAGVALRTIGRLEKGQGVSLDTFIRVMTALGIQHNLETLLPDPTVRPIERIATGKRERRRARPKPAAKRQSAWSWGDGGSDDEQ